MGRQGLSTGLLLMDSRLLMVLCESRRGATVFSTTKPSARTSSESSDSTSPHEGRRASGRAVVEVMTGWGTH